MTEDVVTLSTSSTIADAKNLLKEHNMKSVTVVDDRGRLKGSLKLSDIVKAERSGQADSTVKGVMRTQVVTVAPDTPVGELEDILVTTVGRVPVIDDTGTLLGIVTRTDILRLRNYYASLS